MNVIAFRLIECESGGKEATMKKEEGSQKSKDTDSLRTVQRALDILGCFFLQEPELSLTEIANKIALAKSTTSLSFYIRSYSMILS
jgi:hypothetical protein